MVAEDRRNVEVEERMLKAHQLQFITFHRRQDGVIRHTRAFKKQFSLTPALYRRSPDWSSYGMRPPLRLVEFTMPQHEFVTLSRCV